MELSTLAKELSQMRQVAKFLPSDVKAIELRAEHFRPSRLAATPSMSPGTRLHSLLRIEPRLSCDDLGRLSGGHARS